MLLQRACQLLPWLGLRRALGTPGVTNQGGHQASVDSPRLVTSIVLCRQPTRQSTLCVQRQIRHHICLSATEPSHYTHWLIFSRAIHACSFGSGGLKQTKQVSANVCLIPHTISVPCTMEAASQGGDDQKCQLKPPNLRLIERTTRSGIFLTRALQVAATFPENSLISAA